MIGFEYDISNPSQIVREPVSINQKHCLHCGRCSKICPKQCISKRG